ncbi:effector-associated domain EAD1-containing protein [Actinoplanes sp. NBRC 103695]|uniref:trypsin-like peptidase domain-containing protein n=1 Tax=Actinoplanes sp. NBRC 103695 TaxID=3032202 RepID=UPI0024A5AC29|nr:effector-associated domain EAD1-containing protein [Actinoplanes sp. NBRC 103695]GLY92936.1 hypothetical protein Acsp02_01920 [Actinoplanes sp. NBRC 103695]
MGRVLDGRTAKRLSDALLDAFGPQRLDELLFYRLSKDRARITMAGNYESIVFDLIRAADSEGWLDRLIVAARQSRPAHDGLRAVASGRELVGAEPGGLESILSDRMPDIHPVRWRARLGELEGQVGRLETGGRPLGTGFLIGPDLGLTCHHVIRRVAPEDARLRLDYRADATGLAVFAGVTVRVVAFEQVADDVALFRLDRPVGEEPIGEVGEPSAATRGWIEVKPAAAVQGDHLVVLQHLAGGPVQMRFGQVAGLVDGLLRHTADTEAGSSGSPCFTLDWTLVGIHQGGEPVHESWRRPEHNRAIPISSVPRG